MKKIMSLTLIGLLTGCATQQPTTKQPIPDIKARVTKDPRLKMPHLSLRDTAPLPEISIIPSERAIEFKEVAFDYIARQVRHNMANDREAFKDITLVLVDYTILPAEFPLKSPMPKTHKGQIYCKKFIEKPIRYFLRLSFYANNTRPPAPAVFTTAETLNIETAPLAEALIYMIDAATREYIVSSLNVSDFNVQTNLDVEPFEKQVIAPAASRFAPPPLSPYSRPY